MLKVRCPILGLFQVLLGVISKLIPDIVDKSLRISKILFEKSFKIGSCDKSSALVATYVLNLSKADEVIEK